jgi:phosphoribosylaminoimidazolecarboxamide formyltransferase/IMP cyclohydrolase
MSTSKKIHSALVSVFNKDGLAPILHKLHELGVELISTGGTQSFIESLGLQATPVESLTEYPSIFGGRVKTLHPKIFGGILHRRDHEQDLAEKAQYNIPAIDLVIVDLYPFEDTVKSTKDQDEIIEKIDIGGISLIRAAAKNFHDTLIVSSRNEYSALLDLLEKKEGNSEIEDRKYFATKAFATSSHYDGLIHAYFAHGHIEGAGDYRINQPSKALRYGENPHQRASFYGDLDEVFEILNGKELSYNNLVDIDASVQLIQEFFMPTVAIIKHTNSCGLASADTVLEAYKRAFACDTTSAFGGVIATNTPIDVDTATEMNSLFFEVLIAPAYEPQALEILKQKKNRIIIRQKNQVPYFNMFKSLLNGVIEQDIDRSAEGAGNFKVVTTQQPTPDEISDLEFAIKAVKHLKSNGIALVKNRQLIGMGCGQTSRVDALLQAIKKAGEFGFSLQGAVMASDAFFPFPDCVGIAAKAGITAISQPGGSIKDQDSIDAANANHQAMVLTGIRHFKH